MPEEVLRHIFGLCRALWIHSGDPVDPHVELTEGKCSDGYVDCLGPLSFSNLCQIFAQQLVVKAGIGFSDIEWVVASDHSAAALGCSVANLLGARFDFCEKGPDGTQVWNRQEIAPDERVLHVEELITTSFTAEAVRQGIRDAHPYPISFVPQLLCLIHRSDVIEVDGSVIEYQAHFDINVWESSDCPLCAQGSERISKPKTRGNWSRLTG